MPGFDRVAARSGVALSGSIHKFCDSYNARMGTGEKNVTLVCDGGSAGVKQKAGKLRWDRRQGIRGPARTEALHRPAYRRLLLRRRSLLR
jgi:hypothetical protein